MKNWQKIYHDSTKAASFLVRESVIDAIREFFKSGGFHEVETPLLVPRPGSEPYLEVFETELLRENGGRERAFLTTSPELSMKKLLAAGVGNMFQVTKSFRNGEGLGGRHNSEFTILEWYRVAADYREIMADTEGMVRAIAGKMGMGNKLKYQGREYDLGGAWPRIGVAEAFEKFAGIDTEVMLDEAGLVAAAKKKGYKVDGGIRWEQAFFQIIGNEIEPELAKLNTPVFLYDYPVSQAALSRKKDSDRRFAERFEVYLSGMELGNAFSELNDAAEQRARMEADLAERKALGKVEYGLDEDFLMALEWGMPAAAGIAVGVDRLVMLFADTAHINDVLWFPLAEMFNLE